MPVVTDPKVLRGMANQDNAGVYQLTADLAIVQTIDFFTPIVDDPYTFGQIAVANSLSDVYTMGAKPLTAMNIVCFPSGKMDISVLKNILRGGADKMLEAGVILIGGHSIDDVEIKYGLSVTGTVHPKRLVTNGGARPGDKIILTKPLGIGILSTALKRKMLTETTQTRFTQCMVTLNKTAAELMQQVGAHACTDITGFGLIGHTVQLAVNSQVGIRVDSGSVPFFPEAGEFALRGVYPGGLSRNRDFYSSSVKISSKVAAYMAEILFDPQTSGGLLICVGDRKARTLLNKLHEAGISDAAIIGEVVKQPVGIITVE